MVQVYLVDIPYSDKTALCTSTILSIYFFVVFSVIVSYNNIFSVYLKNNHKPLPYIITVISTRRTPNTTLRTKWKTPTLATSRHSTSLATVMSWRAFIPCMSLMVPSGRSITMGTSTAGKRNCYDWYWSFTKKNTCTYSLIDYTLKSGN